MKNVAVLGAGTMGNGIAHTFAQFGYQVNLIDISESQLQKGIESISKNLERMAGKDLISKNDKQKILQNISTYTNLKEGVKQAGLVIEAATENIITKLEIFKKLNKFCNENTILATNTSSISITKIASVVSMPERVIGMHFMNPVPIMRLVEVIKGLHTSDTTSNTIVDLSEKLDKVPVLVNDY